MLKLLTLFLVVPVHTAIMCLLAPVLPRRGPDDLLFRRIVRGWASTILWAAKIEVSISPSELELLVSPESQVIVCNHQSNIDSIVFLATMPAQANACFAAKSVLFRIPFYGSALRRIGSVEIERTQGKLSMERLRANFIGIGGKKSLILFAEGTRSPAGQLAHFKKGAFVLARDANARLVPFFMSGTAAVMPKGTVVPRPGRVKVSIMPPVAAAELGEAGVAATVNAVHAWMLRQYESAASSPAAGEVGRK